VRKIFIAFLISALPAAAAIERGTSNAGYPRAASAALPATSSAARGAVSARSAAKGSILPARSTAAAPAQTNQRRISRSAASGQAGRGAGSPRIVARAADGDAAGAATPIVETRTGAAYEKCKNAYFTCMDQFCAVKNESYKRCSCSDKVFDMAEQRRVLESAAEKINDMNASYAAVGLTPEQATAMKNATEGELAMGKDNSASKKILSAIMNSISGEGETKIAGNAMEKLNSVSFGDTSLFAFETDGQTMASYDGSTLYTAVYGQCRNIVRDSCTNDGLQRAVTAYLMAIENDCSVVAKMVEENRKKMNAAVRESGAMLELARIENRKSHNALDARECLGEVEYAITSDQACGAGYRKCLDNGEFIDKDTGRPFPGVANFNELANLLQFSPNADIADQKLTQIAGNRTFVENFVRRNKKFAEGALDKCRDIADGVWRDYLDKAILEIHYAQIAKTAEIKQGCFEYIRQCYGDTRKSLSGFLGDDLGGASLQPQIISLSSQMCNEYINSCDALFGGIVSEFLNQSDARDVMTACRNIAKVCFDSYGGSKYSNFYNPGSGLFKRGEAMNWFTLYDQSDGGKIVSPCARQVNTVAECASILEEVFGGFDRYEGSDPYFYGWHRIDRCEPGTSCNIHKNFEVMRLKGVATEMYNSILSILRDSCKNYDGYFMLPYDPDLKDTDYCTPGANHLNCKDPCMATFFRNRSVYHQSNLSASNEYNFPNEPVDSPTDRPRYTENAPNGTVVYFAENICPNKYVETVDVASWGICSCWENGGRRPDNSPSKWPGCFTGVPSGVDGQSKLNMSGVREAKPDVPDPDANKVCRCNIKFDDLECPCDGKLCSVLQQECNRKTGDEKTACEKKVKPCPGQEVCKSTKKDAKSECTVPSNVPGYKYNQTP